MNQRLRIRRPQSAERPASESRILKVLAVIGLAIATAIGIAKVPGWTDGLAYDAVGAAALVLGLVVGVITRIFPKDRLSDLIPVLAAAIALVGGLLVIFWWTAPDAPLARANPMTGDVNVAVAEFEVLDGDDDVGSMGAAVAGGLYAGIDAHLDCGEIQPAGTTRQDFLFDCRPPDEVPLIIGPTDDLRAGAASSFSRDVLADVVLYGTVTADGPRLRIAPKMYIADRQLTGASELAGVHELTPHEVNRGQTATVNRDLRAESRSIALDIADLILALSAYSSGEYVDGLAITEALIERDTFPFNDELLHLLAGNLHLQLDELDAAEAEYAEALSLNEEYGRAHIGLGEVAYQRAVGSDDRCAADTVGAAQIERALTHFRHALESEDQPTGADVESKARFGMARAHICGSRAGLEDGWETARRLLDEIVGSDAAVETESVSVVADSLILTSQVILESARSLDENRAAIDPLERALALDPVGERVASAHALLGLTYERLGAVDAACKQYEQAFALTEDPARAASYAEAGQRLACG